MINNHIKLILILLHIKMGDINKSILPVAGDEILTKCVMLLAKIANKHTGLLCGGAVRDFIVRGETFKDLDFRFKSIKHVTKFTSNLNNKYGVKVIKKHRSHLEHVISQVYEVIIANTVINIDLSVSDNGKPKDYDFIANGLTFNGQTIGHSSNDPNILKLAIEQAKQKILVPNPDVYHRIRKNKRYYQVRIKKFESRGWTIADKEKIFAALI
jgi:hypothetical protein